MTVGPYGKYGWGDFYYDYPPGNPNTRFINLSPNMLFAGGVQYTFTKGSTHYNWTVQTIDDARARGIKWIAVLTHHNFITMGYKYDDLKADFFNLMVEKKVDLLFQGNEHNYQRSKQFAFNGTTCTNLSAYGYQTSTPANMNCIADDGSDNNYIRGKGTVLVIVGTGGINNYDLNPADPRAAFFAKYYGNSGSPLYGYIKVDATDQALNLNFIRSGGANFTDSFTITDPGVVITPPPSSTPVPTYTPTPRPSPTATPRPSTTPPPGGICQKLYIPSYFYPGTLWTQAIANASKVDSMIINPNSGPGTSVDSAYLTTVNQAKSAGIRVYGYTHSQYGARSVSLVKTEVDQYKNWYGVTDIFVDEASGAVTQIPYYQDIANYVHQSSGAKVVLNPGTTPDQGYMNVADAVMNFENSAAAYQFATFPGWVFNYPAEKFIHLVYDTPEASLSNILSLSRTRNAGLLYVTPDILPNPWDTLPAYMTSELNQLTCSSPSTPSPSPAPKLGDVNNDGRVDGVDYVVWLNNYGKTTNAGPAAGDFNVDTRVDGVDYVLWLNNFHL
jgi:hypothetical protein